MQSSSTSLTQRQRLIARFNHLLRQYENLGAVAAVFGVFGGRPAEEWIDALEIKQQFIEQRAALESGDLEAARRGLGGVTGALQSVRERLMQFSSSVSAYLLRTRFQQPGARREEVAALLQFLLSKAPMQGEDFDKLDYLATRFYGLSCGPDGQASSASAFENLVRREYQLMFDEAGLKIDGAPDPHVLERFQFFREELQCLTTFEQFTTQGTLDRLREFKAEIEAQWFYPDVLIEVARTNLLAGQRFQELANSERQQIDHLATRLLSAGVSQVEQPAGGGMLPVDDAKEISELNVTLLDQDYRRNKERLTRLAQLRGSLERAHELVAPEQPKQPAKCEKVGAELADEQFSELETILEELSPTPDRLQQDLRVRITRLSESLSTLFALQANGDTMTLALDSSSLSLAPWECAAFQDASFSPHLKEKRLRRLLRVSVALMAELQEKVDLISRGVTVWRMRNIYLTGARYLVQLSQQTARELELRCANTDASLQREVRDQLERTRRKLLDTCSQFSAKVRSAAL
jgi:hypothetical protein